MLRMYWDVGETLQLSQDADGWGKKTLQRLAADLKNEYSEIKGFSVRNMQCMIQFFNEYNQELTMVKGGSFSNYATSGCAIRSIQFHTSHKTFIMGA